MAENSAIEWTTHTFNPWIGCQKVGPGCDHCYAEAWDARGLQQKDPRWGAHALRTRTGAGNWAKPKAWNRAAERISDRPRVFCASLADVFDNHVSIDVMWRQELGLLIESTPHMDWMLLTKRIANARKYFPVMFPRGVPLNVWLGATIVTQAEMDRDAATLGEIKAEYGITETFFSMEPMFEVVLLNADALPDLVIVGGESGAGARPLDPQWVRPLRDHCVAAGVAFHFKQLQAHVVEQHDVRPHREGVFELVERVHFHFHRKARVAGVSAGRFDRAPHVAADARAGGVLVKNAVVEADAVIRAQDRLAAKSH